MGQKQSPEGRMCAGTNALQFCFGPIVSCRAMKTHYFPLQIEQPGRQLLMDAHAVRVYRVMLYSYPRVGAE
jgi:hypothetical protein